MPTRSINFLSLNVNGIQDHKKRAQLFTLFKLRHHDIVCLQETHIHSIDLVERCKREWQGPSYWSIGTDGTRGVAILVHPRLDYAFKSVQHDDDKRVITLEFISSEALYTLICVYCHNSNNYIARNELLERLIDKISINKNYIIAGDFNCVENMSLDKQGGSKRSYSSVQLQELRTAGLLTDAFRFRHPTGREFTHHDRHYDVHARLDRVYVSDRLAPGIREVKHVDCLYSDHKGVSVAISSRNVRLGGGYWKCNVAALKDPHLRQDIIDNFSHAGDPPGQGDSLDWWETRKRSFKNIIKIHCSRLATIRRGRLYDLDNDLVTAKANGSDTSDILAEVDDLLKIETEGARVRARVDHLNNVDKSKRSFLRAERQRVVKHTISALNINGRAVTQQRGLSSACHQFYSELYRDEQIDERAMADLLADVPKLEESLAEDCEGPITFAECSKAVSEMKADSSPGSDGLPSEFYKEFFSIIGHHFVAVVNDALEYGCLSTSQRTGYVTLLCKDKDKSESLDNWRPITLLNTDYKIISKSIINRMSKVASTVIGEDQTCGVPTRSIADSLHLVRSVVDYATFKNLACALVSFDQSKAFDRVSHAYLFKVLEAFGFGPSLIAWVRLLYTDVKSRLLINGFLTEFFSVSRSMRQGCGLSPLLYVFCIEPLAIKIRDSPNFKGMPIPGCLTEARVSLYADDTSAFAANVTSVMAAITIFNQFGKASGAKLNENKCKILVIGGSFPPTQLPAWLERVQTLKLCGVYFGQDAQKANEKSLFEKINTAALLNSTRSLSIRGRAIIANVMIMSKLWYVGAVAQLSKEFFQRVTRTIFQFIWRDRREWVARDTVYLPPSEGGTGVYSPADRIMAFRINHMHNYMWKTKTKWHAYFRYFAGLALAKYDPRPWANSGPVSSTPPPFYAKVIKVFNEFAVNHSCIDRAAYKVTNIYEALVGMHTAAPIIHRLLPLVNFSDAWKRLERLDLSAECRDVMWRLMHHVLPLRAFMHRFYKQKSRVCCLCGKHPETHEHTFVHCHKLNRALAFINNAIGKSIPRNEESLIYLEAADKDDGRAIAISELIHATWMTRNAVHFERERPSGCGLRNRLRSRLRVRIKADFQRLAPDRFKTQWKSFQRLIVVTDGECIINL